MIVDLDRFIGEGRPIWARLAEALDRLERDPQRRLGLEEVRELHYLYQRTSSDLARAAGFSSDSETRGYLEALVARAYAEVHEVRDRGRRFSPGRWVVETLPRTFRRHLGAFALAVVVTLSGSLFGGLAVTLDPAARDVLMPFPQLLEPAAERVAREERATEDRLAGYKVGFSASLMTHNVRVSLLALALGATWGLGTVVLLFYNGVILGAVAVDYLAAGEAAFLLGWLLPHGAVEIPAILVAGQAGFVLAGALIGRGDPRAGKARLRKAVPDLVNLACGLGLFLAWAGIVEAFLSQYHEPVLPYGAKIGFGALEVVVLCLYLWLGGRSRAEEGP